MPFLPESARTQEEDAYFIVGSLFGLWHQGGGREAIGPDGKAPFNLGGSLAELTKRRASALDGVERRFTTLLDARRADLPHHLRYAVALLKTEGVRVDWLRLLQDIRDWDTGRRVQRAWGRSFWGSVAPDHGNSEPESDAASGTE